LQSKETGQLRLRVFKLWRTTVKLESLFNLAPNVSTPLILAGIVVGILWAVFKLVIQKSPVWPRKDTSPIVMIIIHWIGALALISIIFGFAGFIMSNTRSSDQSHKPNPPNADKPNPPSADKTNPSDGNELNQPSAATGKGDSAGKSLRQQIEGSRWLFKKSFGHSHLYEFFPGGKTRMECLTENEIHLDTTWSVTDDKIILKEAKGEAVREGRMTGGTMKGTGRNDNGDKWTWAAEKLSP